MCVDFNLWSYIELVVLHFCVGGQIWNKPKKSSFTSIVAENLEKLKTMEQKEWFLDIEKREDAKEQTFFIIWIKSFYYIIKDWKAKEFIELNQEE